MTVDYKQKAIDLAQMVVNYDMDICPYCEKGETEEQLTHESHCPVFAAEKLLSETNKKFSVTVNTCDMETVEAALRDNLKAYSCKNEKALLDALKIIERMMERAEEANNISKAMEDLLPDPQLAPWLKQAVDGSGRPVELGAYVETKKMESDRALQASRDSSDNLAKMWTILRMSDFDEDGNEFLGGADLAALRRLVAAIQDDLKGERLE